jgi:pimeloyl-ACP methyl ester carboxylesterase
LRAALPAAGGKLLVLVHGLCMNDLQWQRGGHDHGAALAHDLGYTPLYLHYNSGLPIAANGAQFAQLLDELVAAWPVPLKELAIVGHSMGGLVARSACHAGRQERQAWLRKLKQVVFLGSPLLGAPLERAGSWLDMLLGVSPYTAPFARLGNIRSAGVKDLRHGAVAEGEPRLTLSRNVRWFALAASNQPPPDGPRQRLKSDGLVPVESALGHHKDPARRLAIPKSHQAVCFGIDHFDLLGSDAVYATLRGWLQS